MPKNNEAVTLRIDRRELATILAALRFWQRHGPKRPNSFFDRLGQDEQDALDDIRTNGGKFSTDCCIEHIDSLCERINTEEHPKGLVCDQCGQHFAIDGKGIANHLRDDGHIDREADADHVPYRSEPVCAGAEDEPCPCQFSQAGETVMEYCTVVVIKDGLVHENVLIIGASNEDVGKQAEAVFIEKSSAWGWSDHTQEDQSAFLDDGYMEIANGSVCITWPDVREVDTLITR